jgi:hypothetical protein
MANNKTRNNKNGKNNLPKGWTRRVSTKVNPGESYYVRNSNGYTTWNKPSRNNGLVSQNVVVNTPIGMNTGLVNTPLEVPKNINIPRVNEPVLKKLTENSVYSIRNNKVNSTKRRLPVIHAAPIHAAPNLSQRLGGNPADYPRITENGALFTQSRGDNYLVKEEEKKKNQMVSVSAPVLNLFKLGTMERSVDKRRLDALLKYLKNPDHVKIDSESGQAYMSQYTLNRLKDLETVLGNLHKKISTALA